MKTIALGEALPAESMEALHKWVGDYQAGRLAGRGRDLRLSIKARILDPWAAQLTGKWDLDYLSWAIVHALGLPI